jgi:hypothetical protein
MNIDFSSAYFIVAGDEARAWSSRSGDYVKASAVPDGAFVVNVPNTDRIGILMRSQGLSSPFVTIDDVRLEAQRRIYARYPQWKQANMTARAVELLRKGEAKWSADDVAESTALDAAWTWIASIRAKSDDLIALRPIPADFADDAYWS